MTISIKDGTGATVNLQSLVVSGGEHAPSQSITPDVTLTGPAAQSVLNTDLLTGTVNGWYDASAYQSGSVQIIGGAGITAGQITFEQTNDQTLAAAGVPLRAVEITNVNTNPNVAAIAIAASTVRMFKIVISGRFIRVRISTAFTGGTVQAVAVLSQRPTNFATVNVQQAVAANLLTTANISTIAAGTNVIGSVFNADNAWYSESTTALAASATFTGTSRDAAAATGVAHRYAKFNGFVFSDQACTIRLEVSADNVTWRRATADVAVTANSAQILSIPVIARYFRVVVVNGATGQTAVLITSSFTAS